MCIKKLQTNCLSSKNLSKIKFAKDFFSTKHQNKKKFCGTKIKNKFVSQKFIKNKICNTKFVLKKLKKMQMQIKI